MEPPTTHVLANYMLAPSKEHPNCMIFEIEPKAAVKGRNGEELEETWWVHYKHEVTEMVELSGATK